MSWFRFRSASKAKPAQAARTFAAPRGAVGFLARLRRDTAGNTLAIMGAALIPLIGFTGSAVDMARLYVVKVRLQQSCDAGVLAGRHAMTDTSWPSGLPAGQTTAPLDPVANTQAQQFFANNFPSSPQSPWFQTTNATFTASKTRQGTSAVANAAYGVATVTVPMALMNYFGAPPVALTVTCQAVYDLADADVMFVLDTTGSMSCYPSDSTDCANGPAASFQRTDGTTGYYDPEKSPTQVNGSTMYSKIESLRRAVLLFDSTMRANADPSTHFRYGFAPYNSAMNIGAAISSVSPQYIQNTNWTYQSRQVNRDYQFTGNYLLANGNQTKGPSSFSLTGIPQSICTPQRYPAAGYTITGPTWSNAGFYMAVQYYNLSWTQPNGGTCSGMQQPLRAVWRYQPYQLNTGAYVQSLSSQNPAVANPSRLDGSTARWRGCVEELNTTTASSFNVSSLPNDLDPDVIPTDSTNLWRPMWADAVWLRNSTANQDVNDDQVNEASPQVYTDVAYRAGDTFDQGGAATCGMAAQRLGVMTAQQVHDYVYANDFRAFGGTYHDVGMTWGNRMLSTKGIFAADTAAWPGRNPPSRSIVFMTDGTMAPSETIYGETGVEMLDQRVTGDGTYNTDYNNHTARFRIECDAAKARGVTIYVVALGTGLTTDLNYCASPGQAFTASSTDQLTAAFASIATRVAKLRISQ
ncbi:TadE/TadG family type IV pilus assembly protein [uncultured Sphingomonas sp.]|uniref:TadE/TadG family type IV pilus assembly protein n=1 Tax=uncultured Sphingomonas sp. TaxID=158754 RepID=UPI0035C9E16A